MKPNGQHIFIRRCLLLWFAILLGSNAGEAVRIKDIADIGGVRAKQLIGAGLVVGLDSSGDRGRGSGGKDFTIHSLASRLERMSITVDPKDIKVKNVAAVMVTAQRSPFARSGNPKVAV